jgi:hypothetical protein
MVKNPSSARPAKVYHSLLRNQVQLRKLSLGVRFIIRDDDQIMYHSPLAVEDLDALQDFLREFRCFVPSFAGADAYSIETYIYQYAMARKQTTFLFDRNLYSQIIALAKGRPVTENTRCAAAAMAFASCANTQIEPNLALYEGAASGARRGWKRDLEIFHNADNIHPMNWASLALGYADRFERCIPGKRLQSEAARSFDPKKKLRFYSFVYPIALKTALISMSGGKSDRKMVELLDWVYLHWQFSAPALLLATQALSHDPPKDIFKNIRSKDRKKALRGVENAAWDLVYVTAWFERIKTQTKKNELSVLCSRDKVLLKVAELLREVVFGDTLSPFEKTGFGKPVLDRYDTYVSKLTNPQRALQPFPKDFADYRARLITSLHAQLLRPV